MSNLSAFVVATDRDRPPAIALLRVRSGCEENGLRIHAGCPTSPKSRYGAPGFLCGATFVLNAISRTMRLSETGDQNRANLAPNQPPACSPQRAQQTGAQQQDARWFRSGGCD